GRIPESGGCSSKPFVASGGLVKDFGPTRPGPVLEQDQGTIWATRPWERGTPVSVEKRLRATTCCARPPGSTASYAVEQSIFQQKPPARPATGFSLAPLRRTDAALDCRRAGRSPALPGAGRPQGPLVPR